MVYDFLSVNLNFVLPLIRILCKCSNFALSLIRSLLLRSPNRNQCFLLIFCLLTIIFIFFENIYGFSLTALLARDQNIPKQNIPNKDPVKIPDKDIATYKIIKNEQMYQHPRLKMQRVSQN